MHIRFLPEADAELSAARVWYRHQRSGLDAELMRRIDETLQRISDVPQISLRVSATETSDCQKVSVCNFVRSD